MGLVRRRVRSIGVPPDSIDPRAGLDGDHTQALGCREVGRIVTREDRGRCGYGNSRNRGGKSGEATVPMYPTQPLPRQIVVQQAVPIFRYLRGPGQGFRVVNVEEDLS